MVRFSACLMGLLFPASASFAQILPAAADVLDAFPHSLVDARAVVVVPATRTQAHGAGLLFVKGDDGWAEPVSVLLRGVDRPDGTDVVLVIRTRRSLCRITEEDGGLDSEVQGFAGKRFGSIAVEGAYLSRGEAFTKSPKMIAELRERLAVLSTPKAEPKPEPRSPELGFLLAAENREMLLGAVAALATFFAAFRRKK
jgi:hypothetical protein